MEIQKLSTTVQVLAAVVAIPGALAGAWSAYGSFFSPAASCRAIRNDLLEIVERNLAVDAKRALMKSDLEKFSAKCAQADPDAYAVFESALEPARPTPALATVSGAPSKSTSQFSGWVSLYRRDQAALGQPNFDQLGAAAPTQGALLTQAWPVPIWAEPQTAGAPNANKVVGRLAKGLCAKVLLTKTTPDSIIWAQIETATCIALAR